MGCSRLSAPASRPGNERVKENDDHEKREEDGEEAGEEGEIIGVCSV